MQRGAPGCWTFECPVCHRISYVEPRPEQLITCEHYVEMKQIELDMFAVFKTGGSQVNG